MRLLFGIAVYTLGICVMYKITINKEPIKKPLKTSSNVICIKTKRAIE